MPYYAWLVVGTLLVYGNMAASVQANADGLDAGEYLYRIAGCASCHTDKERKGATLAGGRALTTPFGIFYSPNITPHKQTGIGNWSDAEFLRALKAGISPDGGNYFPSFPYTSYGNMRREDVLAIKRFLFSRTPVDQRNLTHDVPWYLPRLLVSGWKLLYFRPESGGSETGDSFANKQQRGAYIANALAHCGECHTPRTNLGGLDQTQRFAGSREGPDGDAVPNITPDKSTGIGKWSDAELRQYLKNGMTPDGDFAGGLMAEVIDSGLKYLRQPDLDALVSYLRAVPGVQNQVKKPKAKKSGKSEWD